MKELNAVSKTLMILAAVMLGAGGTSIVLGDSPSPISLVIGLLLFIVYKIYLREED